MKTALEALADTRFLEQLMFYGKIDRDDAEDVFAYYKKMNVVSKPRKVWGSWSVKQSVYLDFGTINEVVDWVSRAARPLAKAA